MDLNSLELNKKKKSYLEFMANERIKRAASVLPFISGCTRDLPQKHVEIIKNEDDLNKIFNRIQVQLDKLTRLENVAFEANNNNPNLKRLPRSTSFSGLMDDPEESKGSFAVEVDSLGVLKVGTVRDQRYYPIKNHVGDVSGLLQYANARKVNAKTPSKSITPWSGTTSRTGKTIDINNNPHVLSDLNSNYSFLTSTTSSNNIHDVDVELIENFKYLIQFCFKSLGKSGADCPKLPKGFKFFRIVNDDPLVISLNCNPTEVFTIEDILCKVFTNISKSVLRQANHKAKKLVIAIPPEYGILEKTELKRAIERAELEVLRILSLPISKAVIIALREQRDGNLSSKVGKHVLIDFGDGAISVALYETHMFKPMKVTSSLLNQQFSASLLREQFLELLNEKISIDCVKDLEKNPALMQKYMDEIDLCVKKGNDTVMLSATDGEAFWIKKSEIEDLLQNYINQTIKLLNAILSEQNICRKNEVKRIDLFSSSFPIVFGTILKTKCTKIADQKNIFIDQKDTNSIASVAKLAKKMARTGKDYLDSSLSSSLGTGDYRGIFFRHLKRGVTLPCCETTTTTTIYDNQESLLVEIFQGERPLTRYCALLGSLNVTELPLDKAEKVLIEVTLTIDKDEVLTVKARELKTNKKLTVVIEKAQMKTNVDNMVIEAIDNKTADEKLVSKLNEFDKLIESVRKQFGSESKVTDKMNEFVDQITEKEQTIDVNECERLNNEIKSYLKRH